jgi:hypothetical protein
MLGFNLDSTAVMATLAATSVGAGPWAVTPFNVDIPRAQVAKMTTIASLTQFPAAPEFTGGNETYGPDRDWLESMREEWVGEYDWDQQQAYLNR